MTAQPNPEVLALAREIAHKVVDEWDASIAVYIGERRLTALRETVAAALIDVAAASRREGFTAGLCRAADYVQSLTEEQSTIRRHQTADIIRALKEPSP